jgi:predicted TIM-barrel fold metal-dependent hydrolase
MMPLPDDVRLMSADDHIIEPAHLWVDRVPAKYRDSCPRIVEQDDGTEAWLFDGELAVTFMGSCRPLPGFEDLYAARYDQMRPGCYDPVARIADMDLDRVQAQLCFPNYARFAGHRFFMNVSDRELALACLQTYNDYLLDEWCATAPDRLFGAAILPLNDIDAAVRELRRVIDKGASAIAFSENPTVIGLPSVHTDHWDPLWAIASEAGLPVCMHIGSSSKMVNTSDDAPPTVLVSLNGVNSMMAAVDWLQSRTLERFPTMKVVLSEGGAGWIPYILERAEKAFHDHRISRKEPRDRSPRERFTEQMYVCMVDEYFALRSLGDIPVDNLLWEGDYPHGDGLFPHNHEYLEKALADVAVDDARKIVETNFTSVFTR